MKKPAIMLLIISGICMCFFCGCGPKVEQNMQKEILGTIVTVSIYTNQGKEPLNAAFARAEELEIILSANEENSELSRLNQRAYLEEVVVSKELFSVIERGVYYGNLTDGALDITIGNLIDLWGIGTSEEKVPEREEILPYIGLRGYEKIVLNEERSSIRFLDAKIKINLGAIAKGYIADEMKKLLVVKYEITNGMLNLGGNVLLIGKKKDGRDWKVGIANPLDPERVIASLDLADKTLVTSGNYQRYFQQDGEWYHHILDPFTGYPANSGFISTSIFTECSMDADALSTATYVMGKERTMELLEQFKDCEGVFILEDGSRVKTSGVASYTYQEY